MNRLIEDLTMNDNDKSPDSAFDETIRVALGSFDKPDFEAWRARHAAAVAYLNPVVTELRRRTRRRFMRIATAAAATAACAIAIWFFIPEKASFAQAAKTIDRAKTITWTSTSY